MSGIHLILNRGNIIKLCNVLQNSVNINSNNIDAVAFVPPDKDKKHERTEITFFHSSPIQLLEANAEQLAQWGIKIVRPVILRYHFFLQPPLTSNREQHLRSTVLINTGAVLPRTLLLNAKGALNGNWSSNIETITITASLSDNAKHHSISQGKVTDWARPASRTPLRP